jgi:outer membrane autotransporter protein
MEADHEKSKNNSMLMNGVKPRNNFSKSILKLKVGVKAKNQMSTTLS